MAYNPYRWFTKGVGRNKKLPSKSPLLLKIRNGDFEYSPYFFEAQRAQEDADRIYNKVYQERSKFSNDIPSIKSDAREASKMRRIAKQKLLESGNEEENNRLLDFKKELELEFGKDLWDKCLEKQRGKGTTEDMYWWYKKQCNLSYTKSELQIRGIKV